jgi:hypothetical protein
MLRSTSLKPGIQVATLVRLGLLFSGVKAEIAEHNRRWAAQLAENPDLANALVKFCAAKV